MNIFNSTNIQNINTFPVEKSKSTNITPLYNNIKSDSVSFGAAKRNEIFNNDIKLSHLSERVNIQPNNKNYTVVSMPKSMEIQNLNGQDIIITKKCFTSDKPCVAVIDSFSRNGEKTFIGPTSNMTHGDFVAKCAMAGLEDEAELLAFDVSTSNGVFNSKTCTEVLNDLIDMRKRGVRIDAVNISAANEVSSLQDTVGLNELTDEEALARKSDMISGLATTKYKSVQPIAELVSKINELIDLGTEVYIGSGNNEISLFSLSNAHCVGGTDLDGNKCYPKNSSSPFITDKEVGVLKFKPKFDGFKCVGVQSQNGVTFLREDFPQSIKPFIPFTIKGSSFATPCKLNKDLKQKLGI